ncbi:MAG: type I-U CRISPR-associated protein Csb2 [Bryobacteraceae bacterium]|jgi:CRISPR-associated protein Csb2
MIALILHCGFVAHSYQGVRLTPENKEELDWPPSPARIHQALMAAALTGLPSESTSLAEDALEALRWLERQPPPEIIASAIPEDADSATRFRLAIPQNNPAKNDLTKTSVLLKPTPLRRAIGRRSGPLRVDYMWRLDTAACEEEAGRYLGALADLAAQVRYLGRAEDRIEAQMERERVSASPEGCQTWRPTNQAAEIDLWVAKSGTTNGLVRNHTQIIPARTRKSPSSRFLRIQGYTREAAAGLLPVHVALFRLVADTGDPDELPLSCDAENAGVWRSRIRQKAVDAALDQRRWDQPELAQELITGHPPGQSKRTEQPHLAFVPLPSISVHGKADGRVRRFGLVGYARAGLEAEAAEVYGVLCASLNEELVEAGQSRYRLQLLTGTPEMDKVWVQFLRSSRVWHSVTPVALAGGFKVPKYSANGARELTSNERHVRRLAEWTALLRCGLRHIGLPAELVDTCTITLTRSPLLPSTNRAEYYRPPGESAVLIHARLEFAEPVRGPLIVGDRRYQGYGLLFPY